MANLTFEAMSLLDCQNLPDERDHPGTIFRQTIVGCKVLLMLQDLYMFNVTYVFDDPLYNLAAFFEGIKNTTTDIYVRPMALFAFEHLFPVHPIVTWRYGYIVRREDIKLHTAYYSLPFNQTVWICLFAMTLLVTLVFFTTHWWESRLLGTTGRPSLTYELMIAVGAYCQHVLPVQAQFQSRQLAYLVFFLFTYVISSYYSSTLLSHMVTDKVSTMTLEELEERQFKIVTIDNVDHIVTNMTLPFRNKSVLERQLPRIMKLDVESAVHSLKTRGVALLSDYSSVYPYMRQVLSNRELCEVTEVDIFSSIDKFFVTSKKFKLKEQFKIGTIRLNEAGLLQRLIKVENNHDLWQMCPRANECESTRFTSLMAPLLILAGAAFVAVVMMVAERVQFERNRVFPFVN